MKRLLCWIFGHPGTYIHPGPGGASGRALETCYRCGLTRFIGEPWSKGTR